MYLLLVLHLDTWIPDVSHVSWESANARNKGYSPSPECRLSPLSNQKSRIDFELLDMAREFGFNVEGDKTLYPLA